MMIKEQLQNLSEDDFRKKIVVPLMKKLGCFRVEEWCGPRENGKDILYGREDIFIDVSWGGIILKNRRDITKSRRDDHDVTIMKPDIEDAINTEIPNSLEPTEKTWLHELCIMTSFDINREAKEFINRCFRKSMPYIKFIDGDKLVRIIQHIIGDSNYAFDVETFKAFCEGIKATEKKPKISSTSYKREEGDIVKE